MQTWRSLVSQLGFSQARSTAASLRLTQAYQAVFCGSPGKDDQELVLADLRSKSGFDRVTPPSADSATLRHREGMRELFSIIFGHLTMPPDAVRALQEAARMESVADDAHPSDYI